jgi:hypothetical protein
MKARISILWMILSVNYLGLLLITGTSPGRIKAIVESSTVTAGSNVPFNLTGFIMAWLAVTLNGAANRWTNMVMGILMTIVWVVNLVISSRLQESGTSNATMIVCVIGLLTTLLIVFYSRKLPAREE